MTLWMFPKIGGFPPKSSIFNRVWNHCKPSILGVPQFLETPILHMHKSPKLQKPWLIWYLCSTRDQDFVFAANLECFFSDCFMLFVLSVVVRVFRESFSQRAGFVGKTTAKCTQISDSPRNLTHGRTHERTDPEKTWVSIIALSRNLLGPGSVGIRSHSNFDGYRLWRFPNPKPSVSLPGWWGNARRRLWDVRAEDPKRLFFVPWNRIGYIYIKMTKKRVCFTSWRRNWWEISGRLPALVILNVAESCWLHWWLIEDSPLPTKTRDANLTPTRQRQTTIWGWEGRFNSRGTW